jgi:trans-aconitate methyltransferase
LESGSRQAHWEGVYSAKAENEVSWFQENPAPSLELIEAVGATVETAIIDVGGGASRLVDSLLAKGFRALSVLDLSGAALDAAKSRLGAQAEKANWIVADVTLWEPTEIYGVWHDRAAFHFLTEERDRAAYIVRMKKALRAGGHAIVATFAPDGPERCSGLPIMRYDAETLGQTLGQGFELIETRRHTHATPWGSTQSFQFSVFRFG